MSKNFKIKNFNTNLSYSNKTKRCNNYNYLRKSYFNMSNRGSKLKYLENKPKCLENKPKYSRSKFNNIKNKQNNTSNPNNSIIKTYSNNMHKITK